MIKDETPRTRKEIRILNAVLKLVAEGNDADRITARQIARAAGIGKGTIYGHFHSKDEILFTAMGYFLSSEIEKLERRAEERKSFKDKIFAVYGYIFSRLDNPNSLFRVIIGKRLSGESGEFCLPSRADGAVSVFAGILRRGAEEGIIPPQNDAEYVTMVFMGNIFALCNRRERNPRGRDRAAEKAYDMLVKSLG